MLQDCEIYCFAGVSLHISAQKMYRLGQEGVNGISDWWTLLTGGAEGGQEGVGGGEDLVWFVVPKRAVCLLDLLLGKWISWLVICWLTVCLVERLVGNLVD